MADDLNTQSGEENTQPASADVVARKDYEELLVKASSFEEKATLFDELIADPEFRKFLDDDGNEDTKKAPTAKPGFPPKGEASPDVKALVETVEALTGELRNLKQSYQQDKEAFLQSEASNQIAAMKKDKDNFPFFEESEVQKSMAEHLEQHRATNMVDAYRLATYGRAVATGRNQAAGKMRVALPLGQRSGSYTPPAHEKRDLRAIIGDAMDKHGISLNDSEE